MTELEQLKQDYADGRNIFRRPSVAVLFEKITELEITNAKLEAQIRELEAEIVACEETISELHEYM